VIVEVGSIAVGAVCAIGSIGAIHMVKVDSSHVLFALEIFVSIESTLFLHSLFLLISVKNGVIVGAVGAIAIV